MKFTKFESRVLPIILFIAAATVLLVCMHWTAGWTVGSAIAPHRFVGANKPPPETCGMGKAPSLLYANYAQHANVTCYDIVRGDPEALSKATTCIGRNAATYALSKDEALSDVTCSELLCSGYASSPGSRREKEFPLAFGIRMHTDADQAELLLRTIYAPQNVYCLHIDPKSVSTAKSMRHVTSCFPNVFVVNLTEAFTYGSISPVRVDLACMRLLLGLSVRWRYFINLAGQEMPLKTNYELVLQLELYNGSNSIFSALSPIHDVRYKTSFWCLDTNRTLVRCNPRPAKPPPPGKVTIYKGLAYCYFSRAFVEYVLEENGFALRLFEWFNDTYSPDENYWATLNRLATTPGSHLQPGPTEHVRERALLWLGGRRPCHGTFVRRLCVFGVGDLPMLIKRPEAFVNKFRRDLDPLAAQCLAEYVSNRTKSQQLLSDN